MLRASVSSFSRLSMRGALRNRRRLGCATALAASGGLALGVGDSAACLAEAEPCEEPLLVCSRVEKQGESKDPCSRVEKQGESKDPDPLRDLTLGDISDEMTDGPGRYVVYARRAAQLFLTRGRMIAYTSDVGEAARPVVTPGWVKLCYGITFGYVGVYIVSSTVEEYVKGASSEAVARVAAHATIFQGVANIAVPSLIIHQGVHLAQNAAAKLPKGRLAFWLPSLVGLALIPLMPLIDHPVEGAIDAGFDYAWPKPGGPKPEGNSSRHEKPTQHRETESAAANKKEL